MAKHPVPKKKTSKASRDSRRSHHALRAPGLISCKSCGAKILPHTVCPECGKYGDNQVLEV